MKKVFLFAILIILVSCASDDDIIPNSSTNTLTLKQIDESNTAVQSDFEHYFNTDGRLDSIAELDTNLLTLNRDYTYSTGNKLIHEYYNFGESFYGSITYNNEIPTSFSVRGFLVDYTVPITINENIINYNYYIYPNHHTYRDVEIQFESNDLKKIKCRSEITTNFNTNEINYIQNDFQYDVLGNLIKIDQLVISDNGEHTNSTYLFTYDNKKNPVAESMEPFRFGYLFVSGFSYYITRSIEMSPNNVNSNSYTDEFNTYQYNQDNYPISAEVKAISTNELIAEFTYTYY